MGQLALHFDHLLVRHHTLGMHFAHAVIAVLGVLQSGLRALQGIEGLGVIDRQQHLSFADAFTVLHIDSRHAPRSLHTQRRLVRRFDHSYIARGRAAGLRRNNRRLHFNRRLRILLIDLFGTSQQPAERKHRTSYFIRFHHSSFSIQRSGTLLGRRGAQSTRCTTPEVPTN